MTASNCNIHSKAATNMNSKPIQWLHVSRHSATISVCAAMCAHVGIESHKSIATDYSGIVQPSCWWKLLQRQHAAEHHAALQTPAGTDINKVGISPDVRITTAEMPPMDGAGFCIYAGTKKAPPMFAKAKAPRKGVSVASAPPVRGKSRPT